MQIALQEECLKVMEGSINNPEKEKIIKLVECIEGLITPEACFLLYSLLKNLKIKGEVLEIGSYKGRVTISLAQALKEKKGGKVHSIDSNLTGSRQDFLANLEKHGCKDLVVPYFSSSALISKNWNKPLIFLWHDSDADYITRGLDFLLWEPYLLLGGIVAFSCADMLQTKRFVQDYIAESGRFKDISFHGEIVYAYKIKDTPKVSYFRNFILRNVFINYYATKNLHRSLINRFFPKLNNEDFAYKRTLKFLYKTFLIIAKCQHHS